MIDFTVYKNAAKWAFYINQGCSSALHGIPGCPYPIGTPEYEAFCYGHTAETNRGKQ